MQKINNHARSNAQKRFISFSMNYLPLLLIAIAISTAVISTMLTLADVASRPAAHTAPYAVRQFSSPTSLATPDQETATLAVRLSGKAPGHSVGDKQWQM